MHVKYFLGSVCLATLCQWDVIPTYCQVLDTITGFTIVSHLYRLVGIGVFVLMLMAVVMSMSVSVLAWHVRRLSACLHALFVSVINSGKVQYHGE